MLTRKHLIYLSMVLILLVGGVPGVMAQQGRAYPTIIMFDGDVTSITVAAAEAGETPLQLTWRIVGMGTEERVLLHAYQLTSWVPLLPDDTAPLPAVGSYDVLIAHPLNFGPPTYRLMVVDADGQPRDQRILTIPWQTTTGNPQITTFVSAVQALDVNAVVSGEHVAVTWQVINRGPLTNLIFEQVFDDGEAAPVELPRPNLWIPSAGAGELAPVLPVTGNLIRLRLRVVDMETGSALAEQALTPITLTGTLAPTPVPTQVPPPAASSTAQIVAFTANSQTVTQGNTVTVSWEVANAAQVGVWLLDTEGRLSQSGPGSIPRGSWTVVISDAYNDVARFMIFASDARGQQVQASLSVSVVCPYTYFFTSTAADTSCPAGEPNTVQAAFQTFERGSMLWRADTGDILVLYRSGQVGRYRDTWQGETVMSPIGEPPSGVYLPQRGFGRVWADNPAVQDGLGWATTLERGYTMTYQRSGHARMYITWPDGTVIYIADNDTWGYN